MHAAHAWLSCFQLEETRMGFLTTEITGAWVDDGRQCTARRRTSAGSCFSAGFAAGFLARLLFPGALYKMKQEMVQMFWKRIEHRRAAYRTLRLASGLACASAAGPWWAPCR